MKISWTGFKVSIAGAKLSHLVQKDKIWDKERWSFVRQGEWWLLDETEV
jgi:hypothetical protein